MNCRATSLARSIAILAAAAMCSSCAAGSLAKVRPLASSSNLIDCSTSAKATPVNNDRFMDWLYQQQNYLPLAVEPVESWTNTHDSLQIDFLSATRFAGGAHVSGAYTTLAFYDPVRRLALMCLVLGDGKPGTLLLVSSASPPAFPIVARDLSSVKTSHGLGIGSTIGDVRRLYGPAFLEGGRGGPSGLLSYVEWIKTGKRAGIVVSTGFVIVNGRVGAVWRSAERAAAQPKLSTGG